MIPGRSCPLHYRYAPEALAGLPSLSADPLLVVGGLYGNTEALKGIDALAAAENATVVFNGDFHWFDADATLFECFATTLPPATSRRSWRDRAMAAVAAPTRQPSMTTPFAAPTPSWNGYSRP